MTLTRFEIVQGDKQLTSNSGLALIGALLERSGVRAACDAVPGAIPEREGFTLDQLVTAMNFGTWSVTAPALVSNSRS